MRISPHVCMYVPILKYRNASSEVAYLQFRDIVYLQFDPRYNEHRMRAIHKITVVQNLTNRPSRLHLIDIRVKLYNMQPRFYGVSAFTQEIHRKG